jgi:hypothetical protein
MNWLGFNFWKEIDKQKAYNYNVLLKFIKKIIEINNEAVFEIKIDIDEKLLSNVDAISTIGTGKRNNPTSIVQKLELLENKKIPNLIRDVSVLRSIPKITGKQLEDNYHSFFFNNIKPMNDNFPYDPSYDRWNYLKNKYNLVVKDYHYPGENILFLLQLHTDQSLNDLDFGRNYSFFVINTIRKLLRVSDRKILIRPHPIYKKYNFVDPISDKLKETFMSETRVKFSNNKNLEEDLNISRCAITYNSSASIEALLHGINVINLSSNNPCFSASSDDLNDIENLKELNRDEFLKKVAYLHWETEELKSIENTKYLSKLINKKAMKIKLDLSFK